MDVATKRAVYVWAVLALVAETALVARGWSALLPLVGAITIAAAVASSVQRRSIAVVLVFTYLAPAVIQILHGDIHPFFSVMWFGALLGAMLPTAFRKGWAIPQPWRLALLLWIFTIMVAVPLAIAREIDFNTALLARSRLPTDILGGLPSYTATWILHTGLGQVLGILWFDWLFEQPEKPSREIAVPLAGGALGMMAVAAYQAFVNVTWLNQTTFGAMGRAAGTLFDANLCGVIAAMWIGLAAVPVLVDPIRYRWLSLGGGLIGWLTVLATGSRTAQIAGLVISAFVLIGLLVRSRARPSPAILALVISATATLAIVLLAVGWMGIGSVGRLWQSLPAFSAASWREFALELWHRNGYGEAAGTMIREFPLFGVGVGCFQTFLPFVAPGLVPDNAQNWYRHVVAELGLVGAVGPLLWTALFGTFVLRRPARSSAVVWPLRGILVAFALIALVGMPGQDLAVSLTFWTVAYWYATTAGPLDRAATVSRRAWVAALATLALFTAGTARLAIGDLRPPIRAERIGWPYSYGFYAAERDPRGTEYHWVRARAVTVLEAPLRTMELTVRIPHGDIADHPVSLQAWLDGTLVLDRMVTDSEPLTVTAPVADGRPYVRLETRTSRTVVPSDRGMEDSRSLGAMVSWRFRGQENAWKPPAHEPIGGFLRVATLVANLPLPAPAGSSVLWAASTAGGVAPIMYRFSASDGVRTTVRDWSLDSSWLWMPLRPGVYTIEADARNSSSTTGTDAWLRSTVTITEPRSLTVTELLPDTTTAVPAGTPVTWTPTALGLHGTTEYRFLVLDGTAWSVEREWDTASAWTWTPLKPGQYRVAVWARTVGSSAVYESAQLSDPFTVDESPVVVVAALTADTTAVSAGAAVTWSVAAAGGTGPRMYRFDGYEANRLVESSGWGPSNTWTWTPFTIGPASVQAYVRAGGSAPSSATKRSSPIQVRMPSSLTVVATPTTPGSARVTVPVEWTARALGGTAPYSFRFAVFDGREWSIGREWSPDASWRWTPPRAGTYRFQIWARNAGSSAVYDATTAVIGPVVVPP